jgi:catechol 2,3-dioxygenase-like lactoylglutathione lyase family enzyme
MMARSHSSTTSFARPGRRVALGLVLAGLFLSSSGCATRQPLASTPATKGNPMPTVQVRYIVKDVDAAIAFYCQRLGFQEIMHPAPAFAMLSRGDLRLVLSQPNPSGGGGQPMPDGRQQEPGGWNRFAIEVDDLDAMVASLRTAGAHFRNDIVTGVGGKQILLEDPSGNPVELFQPTRNEARLAPGEAPARR